MKHKCYIKTCNEQIESKYLMCMPHWKIVPLKIQRAVWATFNNKAQNWQFAAEMASAHVLEALKCQKK